MDKKKNILPKDFFTTSRPTVSNKETFEDVKPINWKKTTVGEGVTVYSTKKKKKL